MIEDWEVGILYLHEVERLKDKQKAAESVKNKFFNIICAPKNDVHFYVGTTRSFGTWIIIGAFYPPKEDNGPKQEDLFTQVTFDAGCDQNKLKGK